MTVAEDSTAEEFMDFYLDDHTRTKWVSSSVFSQPCKSGKRHLPLSCCQYLGTRVADRRMHDGAGHNDLGAREPGGG